MTSGFFDAPPRFDLGVAIRLGATTAVVSIDSADDVIVRLDPAKAQALAQLLDHVRSLFTTARSAESVRFMRILITIGRDHDRARASAQFDDERFATEFPDLEAQALANALERALNLLCPPPP